MKKYYLPINITLIRKRSEKKYADVELDLTFGDHTILKIENKMKELGNFDKN